MRAQDKKSAPAKPVAKPAPKAAAPKATQAPTTTRPAVKGAVFGSRVPESAVRSRSDEFGGGVRGQQRASFDQHYGVLSPVAPENMRISQLQGNLNPNINYAAGFHQGTDIAVPVGTETRSVKEGGVVKSVGSAGAYGNQVTVQYPDGSEAVFSHLSGSNVKPGQAVGKGETIGLTGNTGRSTGAHLDFEARKGGVTAAPAAIWNQKSTVGQNTFASSWKGAESGVGGRTSTSTPGTVNAFYEKPASGTKNTFLDNVSNAFGSLSGQFVNLAALAPTGSRRKSSKVNAPATFNAPSAISSTTLANVSSTPFKSKG
jgi:hypothetical protein